MSYLKVDIKLQILDFDKGNYTTKLFDVLEVQNRQAARAWLRAVLTRVPVFTGEARGSLKPLGQFIQVAVPISPVAQRKDHSPEGGALQSLFKFERGYITSFTFTEAVVHYLINEFHNVNPPIPLKQLPRPWDSFTIGKEAYRAYLKKYIKEKLPSVTKFTLRGTKYIKS